MRRALIVAAVLALGCNDGSPPPPTTSPEPVAGSYAVLPVAYTANANVRDAVERECHPRESLRAAILHAAGARGSAVDNAQPTGRYLAVEIASMDARGGGIYSGTKELYLRGTMTQDGRTVGSFEAKRTTMGGAAAPFKGTCAMLERLNEALAKDIASWAASPVDKARLGDL